MMVNNQFSDYPSPDETVSGGIETTRILIDSDPGIDDVMAILLALSCPHADLVAITLTFGNTSLENVTRNLSSIFHVLNLQENVSPFKSHSTPRIAIGSRNPVKGQTKNAEDFHGWDGLGNLSATKPHLYDPHWTSKEMKSTKPSGFFYSELDAVDEILCQVKACPPFSLVVVALGPLTNIAKAWQKDPFTMGQIKRIVIMGGAVNFPGNVTPLSEFNFYADPYAADVVLNASRGSNLDKELFIQLEKPLPLNITLVPLNITHTTFLHRETMLNYLDPIQSQPLPDFFASMLVNSFIFTLQEDNVDGIALHDPLAVAIALGIVKPTSQLQSISVEHQSPLTYGMCVCDARYNPPKPIKSDEPCIEVCYSIPNPTSFQLTLLNAIFPFSKLI